MRRFAAAALLLLMLAAPASAQNNFITPGNQTAAGAVGMCLNASSQAVPCSAAAPLVVSTTGAASGGTSLYFVQPTASDNHASIKSSAGTVYKVTITNNSATTNYVRLYDSGAGFNGCNSATNLKYQAAVISPGIADSYNQGIAFATGIAICVTSGYATTDTTAATASAMSVNVSYQ